MSATREADRLMRQALGGRGFGVRGAGVPPPPVPPAARSLQDGEIELGAASNRDVVGLNLARLIEGRLLIQGNSGAGKSMLLRRIFEQAFGRVQQLLVDPDGEFATLAESFDVAVLGADDVLRIGGAAFALHLREHRYSAVLDLSDATSEERLAVVADMASALIAAPAVHWHPLLVLVDEAQTLAPRYDPGDVEAATRQRARAALADMMGRGRKRGVAGVIATQRIAETATAVVSKATNVVIGRTFLDRDLERSGALLGFTAGASRPLRTLADGEFIALGPALGGSKRIRFRAGMCQSRHKGTTPGMTAPPKIGAAAAASLLRTVPAAASPPPPMTVGGKTGLRRLDWAQEWDAVIRQGYADGRSLAEISADLVAVGLSVSTTTISTRAHALGLISENASRGWSDREDEILRDAYAREVRMIDICGLLEKEGFKRGRVAVQMRAIALGITRDRVNYWTEPEKAIALAGLEGGKTNREIIAELRAAGYERGVTSISKFAQKHNFDRSNPSWSDTEIKKLQELYPTTPVMQLIPILGKTRASILAMASKLNLRQRAPWTEDEKAVLKKAHADGAMLVDIPALLPGRTYATVARMAGLMRLDFNRQRQAGKAKKA